MAPESPRDAPTACLLHLDTEMGYRGGERQMLLLAAALRDRGSYRVILGGPPGALWLDRARDLGLETVTIPFRGDLAPGARRALARTIRELDVDLLHSHSAHAVVPASLARLTSRNGRGCRPFHVVHRRVDFPLGGVLSRRIKYRLGVDRLIAISRAVEGELLRAGLPAERIRRVYSGVPRPTIRRHSLEALGLPADGGPLIGCVAQLTEHKGHRYLIEALPLIREHHPRVHLVLVGRGELAAPLHAMADHLGVGEACRFLGFRDDVPDLLPHFDLFVMPSVLEGLNTSVIDAMALGLPVVASRTGGLPELVVHEVTGLLVPPRSPRDLAKAILRLLQDADMRLALGDAARARYLEHFTADAMVSGIEAVYRELLAARPDPAPGRRSR